MFRPNQTGPAWPQPPGDPAAQARRGDVEALGLAGGFPPAGQGQLAGFPQPQGQDQGFMPPPGGQALPFEAVLAQLKARPGMLEHLEGIDLDGDAIPDIPAGPGPQEPMAAARWQAMTRDRQRLIQAMRSRSAKRKEGNNRILLATLEANDPLFAQVAGRLAQYVQSLPPKIRAAYAQAVERAPGAFLELYTQLRAGMSASVGAGGQEAADRTAARAPEPRERIRRAVSGRMSPPVLEAAGMMGELQAGAGRASERAELVKRVRSGGAREGDLLRYLELCGV